LKSKHFVLIVCLMVGASLVSPRTTVCSGEKPDVPFGLETLSAPEFPNRRFVVTRFGAAGDGERDNTGAFARAIAACAGAGGGRVVVPPGTWLTGPIHLKSNVDLHLEKGARVIFKTRPSDYLPLVFTRWEGVECYALSPLVYGRGLDNVAITGKGSLNGQGGKWWSWKAREQSASDQLRAQGEDGTPLKDRRYGPETFLRPPLVQLINCKNVLLENYTAKNAPFWTNHLVYCENVMIKGIRIEAPAGSPNTDGINLDSTRRAIVRDVFISTGDDAICAKSGLNREGREIGIPTEDVLIEDCHVERAHGGFVIGSEMSGGVRNIMVRNCFYNGAQRGVRLKSRMGRGGHMKNIRIENIEMKRITGSAITINLFYDPHYPPGDPAYPPRVDGVHISGIRCKSARRAVLIRGISASPVKNFSLADVKINSLLGASFSRAEDVTLDNVLIKPLVPPVLQMENVERLLIKNSSSPFALVYLSLQGHDTGDVSLQNNDLDRALQKVATGKEVPFEAGDLSNRSSAPGCPACLP